MLIIIVTSWRSGGAERFSLELATYAKRFKDVAVVATRGSHKDDLYSRFTELLDTNNVLSLHNLGDFVRVFRLVFLRRSKILSMRGTFSLPLNLLFALFGAEIYTFYRESQYQYRSHKLKNLLVYFLERLVVRHSKMIFTNSPILPSAYLQDLFLEGKIQKIDNYIRQTSQQHISRGLQETINICHVGRPTEAKDYYTLIKVINVLNKELGVKVRLHLIGPNLEDYINNNYGEDSQAIDIVYYGYVNDVRSFIARFDVFLFPSKNEGQPNALLEALSTGIPCVASDILPVRDAVDSDFAKTLVKKGDVIGFANAIIGIVSDGPQYDVSATIIYIRNRYSKANTFDSLMLKLSS